MQIGTSYPGLVVCEALGEGVSTVGGGICRYASLIVLGCERRDRVAAYSTTRVCTSGVPVRRWMKEVLGGLTCNFLAISQTHAQHCRYLYVAPERVLRKAHGDSETKVRANLPPLFLG